MSAPKNAFRIIRQCAGLSDPERLFLETLLTFDGPDGSRPGKDRLLYELEWGERKLEGTISGLRKAGRIRIRRARRSGPRAECWVRIFDVNWDLLAQQKRPDYLQKDVDSTPDNLQKDVIEQPEPAPQLAKSRGTTCKIAWDNLQNGAAYSSTTSKDLNPKPNPTPHEAGGNSNLPTPSQGTVGEKIDSPPVPRSSPVGSTINPGESPSSLVWRSYSTAFRQRYGLNPVRTVRANVAINRFIDSVGQDDAPAIAAFYVQHSKRHYLERQHDPTILETDAHALRTQMLTGRVVTTLAAQASERLSTFEDQRNWLVDRIYAERDGETLQ